MGIEEVHHIMKNAIPLTVIKKDAVLFKAALR